MSEDSALQSLVDEIKTTMRDRVGLNKLIEGEEHKDRDRKIALQRALDQLNSLPPLTDFTFTTCPFRYFLVTLATAHLLRSLLFLLERNEVDVADAGGVASRKKQVDLIRGTIQELRQEAIPELREAKKAYALIDAIGYSGTINSSYYGNNW